MSDIDVEVNTQDPKPESNEPVESTPDADKEDAPEPKTED